MKRKQPLTPPKTIRLTSVPREKAGRMTPKIEEDDEPPFKKSNAVSTVAPDPNDSSEDFDDPTTPSPLSVEVKAAKEELDATGFVATCFVGTLDDAKGAARTMSKTQKKVVKQGVLDLNYHDALLSHCLGLSSFDSSADLIYGTTHQEIDMSGAH